MNSKLLSLITGAIVGGLISGASALAEDTQTDPSDEQHGEKDACASKDGCGSQDDTQKKDEQDKDACASPDGCGGKD